MNRKQRRTRGKFVVQRLAKLKSSPLLDKVDLKDIPEDTVKQLIEGTCENKTLQKEYNTSKRILDEIMSLDLELFEMQQDLDQKRGLITKPE